MALVVWKFPLSAQPGAFTLEVPMDSELLCTRELGSLIAVWARVNPAEKRIEKRYLEVCETGKEAGVGLFLGTCIFDRPSGAYVLHVFVRSNGIRQVPR